MATREYIRGMTYGIGFNSITNDSKNTAIEFEGDRPDFGLTGISSNLYCSLVESHSDLADELQVSAAASFSSIFASGSVKAAFLNRCKLSYFSVNLLVHVQCRVAHRVIVGFKAKKDAVKLFSDKDDFFEKYGDLFVSGVTSGGEFFALISINATSIQEKQEICMALSGGAGVGGIGFSVDTSFLSRLEKITTSKSTSVISMQQGPAAPFTMNPVEVVQFALNYPTMVKSDPYPFEVEVMPYSTLLEFSSSIDISQQRDAVRGMARYRSLLLDRLATANGLLSSGKGLTPEQRESLKAFATAQNEKIEIVEKDAAACFKDRTQCRIPIMSVEPLPGFVDQLELGAKSIADESILFPIGTVLASARSWSSIDEESSRYRWLSCDGRSLLRKDFNELFSAIGTIYGSSSAEYFNLPDYRGQFLRGLDSSRIVDKEDRAIGSKQECSVGQHDHQIRDNGHSHDLGYGVVPGVNPSRGSHERSDRTGGPPCPTTDPSFTNISILPNAGPQETRPKNVAVIYLIRAK